MWVSGGVDAWELEASKADLEWQIQNSTELAAFVWYGSKWYSLWVSVIGAVAGGGRVLVDVVWCIGGGHLKWMISLF